MTELIGFVLLVALVGGVLVFVVWHEERQPAPKPPSPFLPPEPSRTSSGGWDIGGGGCD